MKLFNYFIAFNAFAICAWIFNFILMSSDTSVESFIICSLIFALLGSITVYNIHEGNRLNREL